MFNLTSRLKGFLRDPFLFPLGSSVVASHKVFLLFFLLSSHDVWLICSAGIYTHSKVSKDEDMMRGQVLCMESDTYMSLR